MRLALVTHRFVKGDGQGRVNYEIARRALDRGHRASLIASEVAPGLQAHPAATWVPIPVSGPPTELAKNLLFARRSAHWLRQHRSEIDVLHVNGAITWEPGDVNSAHFVHSAWAKSPVHTARVNRNAYGLYQWLYTSLNAAWERGAYQKARRSVAVSDLVREELVGIGVPPERVRVIPNGVDLDEFRPGAADRGGLGLPPDVPLALFVGDIRTPRKNLDTVLRSLAHVPDLHVAVAGSPEGSPYPALAQHLSVAGRVHFLGFRRDVADLMRAADLFVSPARYEPFSLVLLEAMACGLPVVTARSVGAAQLVTPEAGAVIAACDDVPALTEALRRLTADAGLRRRTGQAARAAAEHHGWTQMADRYLDLYEEVVASRP